LRAKWHGCPDASPDVVKELVFEKLKVTYIREVKMKCVTRWQFVSPDLDSGYCNDDACS
jgi:hypothetical protein